MPPKLPTQAELAMIAASLHSPADPQIRMRAAFELWSAAGEFLHHEPRLMEMRQKHLRERAEQEAREIAADHDRRRQAEKERQKDPYGLRAIVRGGRITSSDFLEFILVNKSGEVPEGLPQWTDALRQRTLTWYLTGNEAWYPEVKEVDADAWVKVDPENLTDEDLLALGIADDPEWKPRFPDGKNMLDRFNSEGLTFRVVNGFVDDFASFATATLPVIKRDLSMIAVAARTAKKQAKEQCPACGHVLKSGKCDCGFRVTKKGEKKR